MSLGQADRDYLARCLTRPGDDGPTLRALRKLDNSELLGFGFQMRRARRFARETGNDYVSLVFDSLCVITERALAERAIFPPDQES